MKLGLFALLVACTNVEERLAERRAVLRGRLDALYAEYTAGSAPSPDPAPRDPPPAGTFDAGSYIGEAVRNADRELFEAYCLDVGGGRRPTVTTERARDFFQRSTTSTACRDIAALAAEVGALEAEAAAR
jgi:hypothetical protein